MPTTLNEVVQLAAFVKSAMTGDLEMSEYQAALQSNLIRSLERIAGRPSPKVTPYFYDWDDVLH